MALDLAARVSADRAWPDGAPPCKTDGEPGAKAVIVCRQDHAEDVVAARLQTLGADRQRCFQFQSFAVASEDLSLLDIRPLSLPFDLPALGELLIEDPAIRLVVIDSLSDFCKGKKVLAEVLHALNRLAFESRVAIVVTLRAATRFDRQGQLVVKSKYDTEAARCTWCCVADPVDPTRQLLLPTLMSCAKLPQGMAYRLGELRIDWDGEQIDPRRPRHCESACGQWLRELLSQGDELATEVKWLAQDLDFSKGQVDRASLEIGVDKQRVGFGKGSAMYWSLGAGIVTPEAKVAEQLQPKVDPPGIGTVDDGPEDQRPKDKLPTDDVPTDKRLDDEPCEDERKEEAPHDHKDHEDRDDDDRCNEDEVEGPASPGKPGRICLQLASSVKSMRCM